MRGGISCTPLASVADRRRHAGACCLPARKHMEEWRAALRGRPPAAGNLLGLELMLLKLPLVMLPLLHSLLPHAASGGSWRSRAQGPLLGPLPVSPTAAGWSGLQADAVGAAIFGAAISSCSLPRGAGGSGCMMQSQGEHTCPARRSRRPPAAACSWAPCSTSRHQWNTAQPKIRCSHTLED